MERIVINFNIMVELHRITVTLDVGVPCLRGLCIRVSDILRTTHRRRVKR